MSLRRASPTLSADESLALSLSRLSSRGDVASAGGASALASSVGSDLSAGLAPAAVATSRARFGANRLPERAVKPFLAHFAESFEDRTLQILVLSAAVSIAFALYQRETDEVLQALMMVVVIIAVSGINSYQNWSKAAEFKALAALKEDFRVAVRRGGRDAETTSGDVVVGDIVTFGPGDKLPADGVLLSGHGVCVNQSAMTGESADVLKGAADGDDPCLIGGCMVQQGEGAYLVTAVGCSTKMGQTVKLVEDVEAKDTPLQERLAELADTIGYGGMAVGALTFAVLAAQWWLSGAAHDWAAVATYEPIIKYFIVSITIVVVAVPEGLPLAVTVSLYWFMRQMMRDKNLVRQMHACETMGSATVIASDKTGEGVGVWAWLFYLPDLARTRGRPPPPSLPPRRHAHRESHARRRGVGV